MRQYVRSLHERMEQLASGHRGAIFLAVLAVLFKLVFVLALNDKPPNADGIRYLSAAQAMAAGDFGHALDIYRMPAYPFLIWVMHALTQDWMLAARGLAVASLLGATWLIYRITAHVFDRRAAFWAALAFIVSPMQNEMAVLVYRGPIYLLFFMWAVWWMTRTVDDPRPWRIVAAAWLGVVAVLFRIEGIFLTPLFLAVMAGLALRRRDDRRPILLGVGGWALTVLLLVGMFVLAGGHERIGLGRVDEAWHKLTLVAQGGVLANYERIKAGLAAIEAGSTVPSQEADFGELALTQFWLIYFVGLCMLVVKVLHAGFVVPLVAGLRGPWRPSARWLMAVFGAYFLVLYVSLVMSDYSGGRFAFAASVLLYPWVGLGATRLADWLTGREGRPGWWLALFGVMLVAPLASTVGTLEVEDRSAVAAGRWLAQSPFRDVAIVGNDTRIAYAAGIALFTEPAQYEHYRPESRDYGKIEAFARKTHRPLIFLKLRKTRLNRLPAFTHFKEIRRFSDDRKIVFVFADPDAIALDDAAQ